MRSLRRHEYDERLILVWHYVAGLVGGGDAMASLAHAVARLHDFKGELVVATYEPLGAVVEGYFRLAWRDVGHEPDENVSFCDVSSQEWNRYWSSRRFMSDWAP